MSVPTATLISRTKGRTLAARPDFCWSGRRRTLPPPESAALSRRTLVADITKTSLTSRSGPPCLQGPSARYLINFYSILELTVRALVRQPPPSGRYTRPLRPPVHGQPI